MRVRQYRRWVHAVLVIAVTSGRWVGGSENCPNAATVTSTSCAFADLGDAQPWARPFLETACGLGLLPPCGGSSSESFCCPGEFVTREDMAVFLERLYRGSSFTPPPATGYFNDVPTTYCLAGWIEQLRSDNITSGCSASPPKYCPFNAVTRWQMAVFLAKVVSAKRGEPIPTSGWINGQNYDCSAGGTSLFADVPPTNSGCKFIHYIYAKGITSGCSTTPLAYCPNWLIRRQEMAVFLVKSSNCIAGSCS